MKTMERLQNKTISKKGSEEAGITLIALIITIIILLILATVSIAVLTGDNGIIAQANNARVSTKKGQEREQISLAYNTVVTNKYADGTYNSKTGITAKELQDELDALNANATATDVTDVTKKGTIKIEFTTDTEGEKGNSYMLDTVTDKEKGTTAGTITGPVTETTEEVEP